MNKKQIYLFIDGQIENIAQIVGDKKAVNALSGGVDSAVVTMLAHKALGDKLKLITYCIDTGFMRKDEPRQVVKTFEDLGVLVDLHDASAEFFEDLEYYTSADADGEEKRRIFSDTFYDVFGSLIEQNKAPYLLQGTNKADLEMAKKGQGQHNVRTKKDYKRFGIKHIIEPLVTLYKPDIRKLGKALGLPEEVYNRPPFPGPGLMVRCLGPVDRDKIKIVREAQYIAEKELAYLNPSQIVTCISGDKAKMITEKGVKEGYIIFVRAVYTNDFVKAKGISIQETPWNGLERKIRNISGVARVVMDTTDKKLGSGGTIEYI